MSRKEKELELLQSYEGLREIVGVMLARVYVINTDRYVTTYQPYHIVHKNGRTYGKVRFYGNIYYTEFVDGEWQVNSKYGLYRG